jgi:hypothetical protein
MTLDPYRDVPVAVVAQLDQRRAEADAEFDAIAARIAPIYRDRGIHAALVAALNELEELNETAVFGYAGIGLARAAEQLSRAET